MIEQPTLYAKGKNGKTLFWRTWAEGDTVFTEHGQLDGKKQISSFKVEPKNIGKANETTIEEQAIKECEALWKHKLTRKYFLTIEEAEDLVLLPMLAHSIDKHEDKLTYPCDIQPKLDGVRCLAYLEDNKVKLLSRGGRFWEASPHIEQALLIGVFDKYPDVILDGELYIHGASFQEVTKMVKKFSEDSFKVDFNIYDVTKKSWNNDVVWSQRKKLLYEIESNVELNKSDISNSIQKNYIRLKWNGKGEVKLSDIFDLDEFNASVEESIFRCPILFVRTDIAYNRDDINKLHDRYVEAKYEGAIVRLLNYPYIFSYRSHGLLKVKNFDDDEFIVVGYTNGVGKFEKSVIWECITSNGLKFEVVPKGTVELREKMYQKAESYIGKYLKVKYFGLTDDGKPRFPVGLGFRDEKDLPLK